MFEPEEHRGFLSGLDDRQRSHLGAWFGRRPDGVRKVARDEVTFRGRAVFVATLLDGSMPYRAMSAESWADALMNGLGVALAFERREGEPLDPDCKARTLEAWLAWQEEVRIR